jgi:hypothetical protein
MTYIIGFKIDGVSSIIADTRVTDNGGQGQNTVVKTGIFFPGCIYGLAGNLISGFTFVNNVKDAMAYQDKSVEDLWKDFTDIISWLDISKDDDKYFEILLSCRASEEPKFFVFDPINGLISYEEDWISLGRGKSLLDPRIQDSYASIIYTIKYSVKKFPEEKIIYPYLLCLWLSELSLTFKSSELEGVGVGGVFNFIYQATTSEAFQEPAIYVFNMLNLKTKQIHTWVYRICRIQEALYIHSSEPIFDKYNELMLYDPANVPPKLEIQNREDFEQAAREKVALLPFYFFCGFGFADPRYQGAFKCHFSFPSDKSEPAFKKNGEISSEFKQWTIEHFRNPTKTHDNNVDIHYFTDEDKS